MRFNTKKTPDEELASEVVRAAILLVDYERANIKRGTFTSDLDPEQVRLHRAVDDLRLLRHQAVRAKRVGGVR